MANDKHLDRRDADERRVNEEDEQLRPSTTNEIIREAHGGPDADISSLNDDGNTRLGGLGSERQDVYDDDNTRGAGYDANNAAAAAGGGTTDLDNQTSGGSGLNIKGYGSGTTITTKSSVSGSDFDGQNTTS